MTFRIVKPLLALALTFTFLQLKAQITDQSKKLGTFYQLVNMAYVDEVDEEELVEDAIIAMLKDLDPHSVYIPAKDLEKTNEPLVGKFEGVGIQFNILHDTILVVSAISGGPSEKLGIMAGDKIITINDSVVAGVGFQNKDVIKNLRGKKGTEVKVGIQRGGENKLLDFNIVRDKIPIYSVDASYMANTNSAYLKLNRFAATSMEEITPALDSLSALGMENLILDLRGNSGGYLNIAIELADEFLSKGELIVYTEGKAYPKNETYARAGGRMEKGKLIVLVDEGSASASEIVSGAVQDHDRGLIIGRRTFGKGLVQKPFNLPDGSAIRLTISRYYTPSGRSIQRPYEKGGKDYYKDLYKRFDNGELTDASAIDFPDSLKYETLKNKRTVYGGGGIMPDIFVPLDTTITSGYLTDLIRKGVFNEFSLDYLNGKREELKAQYKTSENFLSQYEISPELLETFIQKANEKEIEFIEEDYIISEGRIKLILKALIARGAFDNSAYHMVMNSEDNTFNKALECLEDGTMKKMKLNY